MQCGGLSRAEALLCVVICSVMKCQIIQDGMHQVRINRTSTGAVYRLYRFSGLIEILQIKPNWCTVNSQYKYLSGVSDLLLGASKFQHHTEPCSKRSISLVSSSNLSALCLESFEMWCWRRMEKISWSDHVRNEEVLLRVNEQRNILHEIRKRKGNWIGHILRRNCLLQQVIEGNIKGQIEVTRRRGRRRKKLLDALKDRRGYCQSKEEALDGTMWRNCFGRGFGPVV